jgi:competence protein ComEC
MALAEADSIQHGTVKKPVLRQLADTMRSDLADIRFSLWVPVLLTTGIWTYFGLSSEPSVILCAVLAMGSAAALWMARGRPIIMAIAIVVLGFALTKARTEWVRTPLVGGYTEGVAISGFVADIEHRGKNRTIITFETTKATGLLDNETPRRIRLTTSKAGELRIGDHITTVANLAPLPRPAMPGGFDYARHLYFDSVGATGRTTSPIKVDDNSPPVRFLLRRVFHDLRGAIGARIRASIDGPLGSFADAIITGERASIPKEMNESLQASGLFHVLSISGLHMSLVAGGVFWLVRAGLAFLPRLALDYPIKKWAASAALLVGLFYMLLADSGPATERSYIMIAVMFFAVLVDRRAISLQNLSLAAIIILVLSPEQALAASFQMSFMAVLGMAAFFEWWSARERQPRYMRQTLVQVYATRATKIAVVAVATSMIAGTLSTIPALHHFGRIAPFSVVANTLAMPVIGFVIMPMALLATVAMPFGLENVPFQLMEFGLAILMQISNWIASWKLAGTSLPLLNTETAILLAATCVAFCLLKGVLRLAAIPLGIAAVLTSVSADQPDLLIDERARNVSVLTDNGQISVAQLRQAGFSIKQWKASVGDASKTGTAAWSCQQYLCATNAKGFSIIYLLREGENKAACPVADILVSAYPLPKRCKGKRLTIDRFDVWRNGAIAITIHRGTIKATSAAEARGQRPWGYSPRQQIRKATPVL